MRLGIFGGTFDPPHLGHLLLAEQALEQLALDTVLWVPAGNQWRKGGRAVSNPAHRLAMVDLAIEGNAGFQASRLEVDGIGPTYSVETLEALRRELPGAEHFLLLGLDALKDLPNWHEPARLIDLATLAVAGREGGRLDGPALEALLPGLSQRIAWLDLPRLDISATDLRRRAAQGRSLRYLVPPNVESYIREHRLYVH